MDTETTPLLDNSDEDAEPNKLDMKQMVWFHGKELVSKTFIRTPQHSMVRIGIGRDGVYTLDTKTAKLLKHWKFSDIKDSNYSGYSFTLQLLNEGDYFVRTDDGESICSYIEAFQKDPDQALEQALNNPPMSQAPESGILTLTRKFSSEPHSAGSDVRFYTLNRRRTKNQTSKDPINNIAHNIEVDSRLRSDYTRDYSKKLDVDLRSRGHSFGSKPESPVRAKDKDLKRPNSLEGVHDLTRVNGVNADDKENTREFSKNKLDKAVESENRHSNRILIGPVSTKGEVTMTQSTKSSAASNPSSPFAQRKQLPINTPSPDSISCKDISSKETDVKSHSMINSAKESSKGRILEIKIPETTKGKQSLSPISSTSDDKTPLFRQGSDSSTGTFSPTDEFQFVPQSIPSASREPGRTRRSGSLGETYDRLESIPLDTADPSPSSNGSRSMPGLTGPAILQSEEVAIIRMSASPESEGSGIYDHLPSLHESDTQLDPEMGPMARLLSSKKGFSTQRNISQPALSMPSSTCASPIDSRRESPIQEESSDEGGTPTNSDDELKIGEDEGKARFQEVKLREKNKKFDPFADLLSVGTPRLRWSQELNPLYDYIKGFKISDDGVKLYDTPSKLTQSINASDVTRDGQHQKSNYKATTSVIVEEAELEGPGLSTHEEMCSPSESSIYSPTDSRPGSSFSNLTTTLSPTHYSRRPHLYEEVNQLKQSETEKKESVKPSGTDLIKLLQQKQSGIGTSEPSNKDSHTRAATLNLGQMESSSFRAQEKHGRSPRIGKRELQQQRRSRTLASLDDTEAVKRKQKPVRVLDELKDFSFIMREYRLFFVKLPNGCLYREIFSINKPVSELLVRLCEVLGVDNPEQYILYVEGACLTTVKETEGGTGDLSRISRTGSLTHLVDSHSLPDQGTEPILLKANLPLRMQGITTSRILSLLPDDEALDRSFISASDIVGEPEEDFHKDWVSVVQGIMPVGQDDAVKLAALQYQAYFLDRTAVHSTIGFCRPTEFLPVEYAGVRGLEQRMYREQEAIKSKAHKDVNESYVNLCSKLVAYNAVFFPVKEARKKLFQNTKLKPVLLGISSRGILRVDPKTKDILDFWDYMLLKNWAYSKRTFVLAFTDKNYPVESNQSKWMSGLVDFCVDSIVGSGKALSQLIPSTPSDGGTSV